MAVRAQTKDYSNPFQIRIFLFLCYSFGNETINTFIHSVVPSKTIPKDPRNRHSKKKIKFGKQNVKRNKRLRNLYKAIKTKHWPRCFTQLVGVFLKKNAQNTSTTLYRKFFEKKSTLIRCFAPLLNFLKLGVLWWKLKIFIANFSHVSQNRFWPIFSMLLNSHPTIKWRWKNFCCNWFDAKPQFDWTSVVYVEYA